MIWRHADEAYSDRVCAAVVVGSLTFPNLCGCARAVPVAAIESVGPACASCGHRIELDTATNPAYGMLLIREREVIRGDIEAATKDIRRSVLDHRLPNGMHRDVPCPDRVMCGHRWLLLRVIDRATPSCYCHECGTASDIPPSTVTR